MTTTIPRSLAPLRALMAMACIALAGWAWPAAAQDADPPGRVGWLSEFEGQVWVYSPEAGDWVAAQRNQPLTTGDRIATESGARAEVQIGSTVLRLDAASELEVAQIDDSRIALDLHEGSAIARIRDMAATGPFEVATDEGRFVMLAAGTYRVDRGPSRSDITVFEGQARYEGPNSGLTLAAGQHAQFWIDSGGVAQYSTLAPLSDPFLAWSIGRDRRPVAALTERYVSPEMTGASELDAYGRWEQSDDYGPLWVPTAVAVDWAPYSHGHWGWVQPWGWTWIDDAPWGFAPFHYGRWVYARDRWCWTPGARVARPVYAPALVGWVGGGGGPRGNVAVGIGGGPVGWFPLAPREVYVPGYRVSPRYAERINITVVNNTTVIRNVFNNPQGPREFENRRFQRGITVVPADVMVERRPVAPAAAQFRQSPGARDFGNGPARGVALLAPPVPAPRLAPQRDPRDVRPPPGLPARPTFNDRPNGAGRERTEDDRQRDRRDVPGRPGQVPAAPGVTAPAGGRPAQGFQAGERAPGAQGGPAGERAPGTQGSPGVERAPSSQANPTVERQPGQQGVPGRIRMPMDNNGEADNGRRPDNRPGVPGRAPGQGAEAGVPGRAPPQGFEPGAPGRAAGQGTERGPGQPMTAPQPQPAQQARPAAAPQEGPTMRAMPIRRSDERANEERRPMPAQAQPQPQQQQAQPPQVPPRLRQQENPEGGRRPPEMARPAPVVPAPQPAPQPAQPQVRQPAPAAAPQAPAQPARPEVHAPEQRGGNEQRRGEGRGDQQR